MKKIKRSNKYVPIGRKLLKVDKDIDVSRDCVFYKKDITTSAFIMSRKGIISNHCVESEEVLVPFFEIAVNPSVRFKDKSTTIKRAKIKAKEGIQKQEDSQILGTIDSAVRSDQTISVKTINEKNIFRAISLIEQHNLNVKNIVIHPLQVPDFRILKSEYWEPNSKKDFKKTSCLGTFNKAKVWVTIKQKPGDIHFLSKKEIIGVIPIRKKITSIDYVNPKNLRDESVLYEEIGMCVFNDHAVSKCTIKMSEIIKKENSL